MTYIHERIAQLDLTDLTHPWLTAACLVALLLLALPTARADEAEFLQNIRGSDTETGDHFGSGGMVIDGDLAAIGIPRDDSPDGEDTGSVDIFLWDGDEWLYQHTLESPAPNAGDRFGFSVDMEDGTLVVGMPGYDFGGGNDMGLVLVYRQGLGGDWLLQDTLEHPDPTIDGTQRVGDKFGEGVRINGETIVVSAPKTNKPGSDTVLGDDTGSIEVFQRDTLGWSHAQTLRPPDGWRFKRAGGSDIDATLTHFRFDSDLIAVRAFGDSTNVYSIFERDGGVWNAVDSPSRFLSVHDIQGLHILGRNQPLAGNWPVIYLRTATGWALQEVITGLTPDLSGCAYFDGDQILWFDQHRKYVSVLHDDAGNWVHRATLPPLPPPWQSDFFIWGCTDPTVLLSGDHVLVASSSILYSLEDGVQRQGDIRAYGITSGPADSDGDGVSDEDENANGTNPNDRDSDDDGIEDGDEGTLGTDPLDPDSDDDGSNDGDEVLNGTDPLDSDSDDDGLSDGDEVTRGTDPLDSDSDDDGLSDGDEVTRGTDPLDTDSDDDGLGDGAEVDLGTDPTNPDSDGDGIVDGADPDVLAALIATLPVGAFANSADPQGQRNALLNRLADVEADIAAGNTLDAIRALRDIRRTVDGCGPIWDHNDWVIDCPAQVEIRSLIDLLIANLGG